MVTLKNVSSLDKPLIFDGEKTYFSNNLMENNFDGK
jgi:hypothetical protein